MSKRDPEEIAERDRIGRERVEQRIRQAVEDAPPLPPEVFEKLRELIQLHLHYVDRNQSDNG